MIWHFSGNKPVYQQIMDILRYAVIRGEYGPGDRIPSVRDMAAMARVNPNTMQHAVSELEHEGMLTSHGTVGRFITEDKEILGTMKRKAQQTLVQEFALRFREMGLSIEQAVKLLYQIEKGDVD